MSVEPKSENMDGHSFEKWRFELGHYISTIGRDAYLDTSEAMVAMFNTNYDPKAAARAWLKTLLERAP